LKVKIHINKHRLRLKCSRGNLNARRVWIDGDSLITSCDGRLSCGAKAWVQVETGELCGVWAEIAEGDWRLVIGVREEEAYWSRTHILRILNAPRSLLDHVAKKDHTGEARKTLDRILGIRTPKGTHE